MQKFLSFAQSFSFANVLSGRHAWLASVVLVALSAWVSSVVSLSLAATWALWLPTALTLGLYRSRGGMHLLGGALGIGLWAFFFKYNFVASLVLALGTAAAAFAFGKVRDYAYRTIESVTARRACGLLAIILVLAPVSALGAGLALFLQEGVSSQTLVNYFGFWYVEVFAGLLITPAVISWLRPVDADLSDSPIGKASSRALWLVILTLLGAAHVAGLEQAYLLGTLLLLATTAVALGPAFLGSERASASTIALVGVATLLEQVQFAQNGAALLKISVTERALLAMLVLSFGAMVLHLLNSICVGHFESRRRINEQAYRHPGSGFYNPRFFMRELKARLGAQVREPQLLAEITFPDLLTWANFSGRNDAYRMDLQFAQQIQSSLRRYDVVFAHGSIGNYFMTLNPLTDPLKVIDTVEEAVQKAWNLGSVAGKGPQFRPRMALLKVPMGLNDVSAEEVIAALSAGLRRSQDSQKSWSMDTLHQSFLASHRKEALELEALIDALTHSQVALFAQPIVSVKAHDQAARKSGLHFEVLARMRRKDGGLESPAKFLPLYAGYGLLLKFDHAVIQKFFEFAAAHPSFAKSIEACSLNLTGPTLSDPDLVPFIEAQLAGSPLSAEQLVFEITESDQISHQAHALENVMQLKQLGASIAIDDFGTGLASFDYLKRFAPDWIKIDGSFVRDAALHPLSREVVVSMIRVAKVVGCAVVAEQVEDQVSIDLMRELGACYLQGYGLAKPEPIEQALERFIAFNSTKALQNSIATSASSVPDQATAVVD